ncbi:unnamed protein product [Lymnaea stagnalis]|uniref:MYND-type domain-containing protein n=1 Tax=Lymnaea stagnalis TaxID=6523 RepID=A0AAV2IL70_LYMST
MESTSTTKWFRVFGQCARCGQFMKTKCMILCQQCNEAKYCSRQCQEEDEDHHKEMCNFATPIPPIKTGQEKSVTNISAESRTSVNSNTGTKSALGTHFQQMVTERAQPLSQSGNILKRDECKGSTGSGISTKSEILSEVKPNSQPNKKKFSDFYHDSDEENSNKDSGQEELAASGINSEKSQADSNGKPKFLLACSKCGKESFDLLFCARCHFTPYCSKDCQRQHYPEHKNLCRRSELFKKLLTFLKEEEHPKRLQSYGLPHSRPISPLLVTMFDEYLGCVTVAPTPRPIITVQIAGLYAHLFRPAVVVEDVVGQQTHIIFHDEVKTMGYISIKHKDKPAETKLCELVHCLKPGNFMVLMDAFWHHFMDGTMGIRVDDLETVHFVHMD